MVFSSQFRDGEVKQLFEASGDSKLGHFGLILLQSKTDMQVNSRTAGYDKRERTWTGP
jgi:hypothetical protein